MCGSKGSPASPMGCTPSASSSAAQLAVDGADALDPGRAADVVGHVLDGQVEVVGDLEDARAVGRWRGGQLAALLLRAPLVVGEVGAARCQPASDSPPGPRRLPARACQLVDAVLPSGRAARVEGLDALLRAGPAALGLPGAGAPVGSVSGCRGSRSFDRSCVQVVHQFVHEAAARSGRSRWRGDRPCGWGR